MKKGIRTPLEHVEDALAAADIAWWEVEFPSGASRFSKNKAEMLGYDSTDFIHYMQFTDLIHPDDQAEPRKALDDYHKGRAESHDFIYRIKAHDNTYVRVHDKGKIVERTDQGFVVAGIVQKV